MRFEIKDTVAPTKPASGEYKIFFTAPSYEEAEDSLLLHVCVKFQRVDGQVIAPPGPVRVNLATKDGSAISTGNEDYFPLSDTLVFNHPVQTECRSIFLANDTEGEADETFFVTAWYSDDSPLPAGSISATAAPVTILDDDRVDLDISVEKDTSRLDNGNLIEGIHLPLTIKLLRPDRTVYTPAEDFPLKITHGGTATEGDDYDLASTAVITAGETSVVVTLRNHNRDYEVELNETVDITVSHGFETLPVRFESVDPASTQVVIKDNDVVEAKLNEVKYEINEGDLLDTMGIKLESVNANVDCLIEFDVHIRIANRPHTVRLKEDPDNPLPANPEQYYPPGHSLHDPDLDDLNHNTPIARVDGYWMDRVVTVPACQDFVPVTWQTG